MVNGGKNTIGQIVSGHLFSTATAAKAKQLLLTASPSDEAGTPTDDQIEADLRESRIDAMAVILSHYVPALKFVAMARSPPKDFSTKDVSSSLRNRIKRSRNTLRDNVIRPILAELEAEAPKPTAGAAGAATTTSPKKKKGGAAAAPKPEAAAPVILAGPKIEDEELAKIVDELEYPLESWQLVDGYNYSAPVDEKKEADAAKEAEKKKSGKKKSGGDDDDDFDAILAEFAVEGAPAGGNKKKNKKKK